MFLSGIFYPIDILPDLVRPIAKLLPLSFAATGLRDIIVNGETLAGILPSLAGLAVWAVVALFVAIRLFRWKEVAA
jgi:ABC-2 type transport system permease protein